MKNKKQKLKCTNCRKEFPINMMSIECPNCYLEGCNKEIKEATELERKRILSLVNKELEKNKEVMKAEPKNMELQLQGDCVDLVLKELKNKINK